MTLLHARRWVPGAVCGSRRILPAVPERHGSALVECTRHLPKQRWGPGGHTRLPPLHRHHSVHQGERLVMLFLTLNWDLLTDIIQYTKEKLLSQRNKNCLLHDRFTISAYTLSFLPTVIAVGCSVQLKEWRVPFYTSDVIHYWILYYIKLL